MHRTPSPSASSPGGEPAGPAPDPGPGGRVNVLGVGLSPINRAEAAALVLSAARRRQRGYVCVTGVHGVMESHDDARLKAIHNGAFLCTPDGMPMVWMGKLQGHPRMGRVYGPDLMLDVCAGSLREGLRHFFYGGANGAAADLKTCLCKRFPGLQVVGTYEPPFRPLLPPELEDLKRQVAAARPDFFWVGLSTPKQERFMAEHVALLDTTLLLGVGAAFDFHTGRVRQAPRWMQRSGMEWFYRLVCEPRRLWKRYFKNNPRFLFHAALQLLRLRSYPLQQPPSVEAPR